MVSRLRSALSKITAKFSFLFHLLFQLHFKQNSKLAVVPHLTTVGKHCKTVFFYNIHTTRTIKHFEFAHSSLPEHCYFICLMFQPACCLIFVNIVSSRRTLLNSHCQQHATNYFCSSNACELHCCIVFLLLLYIYRWCRLLGGSMLPPQSISPV